MVYFSSLCKGDWCKKMKYLASCPETQNFILLASEVVEGRGKKEAALFKGKRAQCSRHPPAEVNSPVPGLLPLHPGLLGRQEGEEKLMAEGPSSPVFISPLHPHPCSPGRESGRRKTASLSHTPFPYPPHWPNTKKKKEELIKAPRPLGGITHSINHAVVGVKLEKKEYSPPHTKWNERRKYLGMNSRLPSQDSSTIWR